MAEPQLKVSAFIYILMFDVVDLLKQEREKNPKESRHFIRRPPYPTELLKQPYPEKYIVPTFSRFDVCKKSALIHISKFIDSMGAYANIGDLCLREFSKSLDDRAYTWYTTLPHESVKTWKDMVELFCGKYFQVEEKITLVNLHTTKQMSEEDLLHYIHHFRDISLDCYANYEEGELVGVCIDNMLPEFRAHLKNLDISRFAQLLQKAWKTALLKSTERPVEEPPPPVPRTMEEMIAILNKWAADGIVKLSEAPKKATEEDKKNPKFCHFHQYIHHSTEIAGLFEGNSMRKFKMEPWNSLNHGKRFRSLFNQLGLNPKARTAATKAIMAIAAESKAHCFTVETHASCAFLETTTAITFTDENMDVQYPDHWRPLYFSATINEVQMRRALVDTGLTRFHVMDSVVPYHILLGRPWLHKHQLVSSTYYQCVKGRLNGKSIWIAANPTPFDQSESHFVEAALYNEVAPAPKPGERILQPSCLTMNEANGPESADASERESATVDPKIFAKEELKTPKLVAHSLNVEPGDFIKPIQHPRWLSNIVLVKKKNGQIRCCVDFRNLNKACPKDEFPLPNMDLLIDSAAGHAIFSFMDGFSGYNQIFMSPKDAEKTAFRTPIGNFYYTVMPFGLKNAGATYQRTMTAMFHDMMHREIEDYVDDIVVKSKTREDHFGILKKLLQYEIVTKTPTAIKSQAIADLLAQFFGEDNSSISDEVPGEIDEVFLADLVDSTWTLRFDGSSIAASGGAGIVLYKGNGEAITKSFKLDFPCSNNAVEYETYLAGLAIAYEMRIKHLRVIGDSNLVDALAILGSQIAFEGEEMDVTICKKMEPIIELLKKEFEELSLDQEDWRTLIKAKLMSPAVVADLREIKDYTLISEISIEDCLEESWHGVSACKSNEEVCATYISTNWRTPLLEYLFEGILPPNPKDVYRLKRLALRHFVEGGTLFRKGFHGESLRCLSLSESQMIMRETHAGECGEHQRKKRLYQYLLTLEAIPLQKATNAAVANFIREHIITRFGIPYKLISDNGTPFINKDVREVLEHYQVKHRHSTPYYPQGNGQAEATNRMLLRILSKMVFDYGNDWRTHLADVLCAYQSSPKTAIGFTPFSLVYGTDTISPTELVVPSSRVMQGSELEEDANMCNEAQMVDLEGLDEVRELAKARSQRNYQKMANVYSKAL
uniref:Integrase catalytic domain-containing protein n=1 Tax=Fagus sylvatica TaxID=28930 RepID=A0A2N9FW41_FAGSY